MFWLLLLDKALMGLLDLFPEGVRPSLLALPPSCLSLIELEDGFMTRIFQNHGFG